MAIANVANTLVVTGTGDQTIDGPVHFNYVNVPSGGTVVFKKGSTTIITLSAGAYDFEFRSASDIIVNGACTIFLKL